MRKHLIFTSVLLVVMSCSQKKKTTTIVVKNALDIERSNETVELTKSFLKIEDLSQAGVFNKDAQQIVLSQLVDQDGDGVDDMILFQPKVKANSEASFEIIKISEENKINAPELCYSRFVPERTDDYTWENNKVAFRVYGPTAQKMIEEQVPGGTLSSGVDAWLKKVEYPIINKWYEKTTNGTGSYHNDTGEGLDNFHVGVSRGVGGLAVKIDTSYYVSKNYTKWRSITNGPIRTSFYLEYENWDAAGNQIKESKVISLDLGSNLSKFTTHIEGVNTVSAGLTLHEKDGEVTGNPENGWVSYWQPHANSELGTAILANKHTFQSYETYSTDKKDLSNAYAHLNVVNQQVVYYAGFAWKESGQFNNKQDWETYLNSFSKRINNPLKIELLK
ncbi:DUF4861 domain-containing protein [Tamlana haliotis]|uniref:DUF4861 domain-containing protein n=2 Tax=Pseudotamlana haliotis TaxID=2614804 RepID=A0A6N6MIQ1_9FLAO|nr:DUF4861 domain-containing protein [Tamlana haliotis]